MARPIKNGLDYFSFDIDFFADEKIRSIGAKFGNAGLIILIRVLCKIYRNGYFTKWNSDEIKIFAKYEAYVTEKKLNEIIGAALKCGFFSNDLFEKYSILSSNGIQKRYFTACKKRTQLYVKNQYLLVNPNYYGIPLDVYSEKTEVNSDKTNQRKGKEIKVNESESNINSLNDFYESELLAIENENSNAAKVYSKIVALIKGSDQVHNGLSGLKTFKEQLSFVQFNQLWNTNCGVYSKYQNALMKINENTQYQKGVSLKSRLISWFDNDKNPETLHPLIKPKKILNTNN